MEPRAVPPRARLSAIRDLGGVRSPNHDDRRGAPVDTVVLHYTVLDAAASLDRLCDPASAVSCHWLVDEGGATLALVEEGRRAWHAGRSRWGAARDLNARSVGIELVNDGASPFPEAQIAALERLLAAVTARHRVPPERVLGHSDVAVGRKRDPGPLFPWRRLAARGLAVWPEIGSGGAGEADPAALRAALDAIGYDPEAGAEARLAAFRLRFRPGASGPADARDAGRALAVAARWPVDARCVDPPARGP